MAAMKRIIYLFSIVSILSGLTGCSDNDFEKPHYSTEASTKFAQSIINGTENYFGHIKSDEVKTLSQGVTLLDMSYVNYYGYAVRMMVYKVVLGGNISLEVTIPDDNSMTKLQPLSEQVAAMDLRPTTSVLGAVNGDAVNAAKIEPQGIVYRDGNAIKGSFNDTTGGFFAILNDGSAGIYDQSNYSTVKSSIKSAIGTRTRILSRGYSLAQTDTSAAARTAVGVSADGGTVYLVVVDGVYFFYSNGIKIEDLASVMIACGASDAALLDAGNNTTLIYRNELSDNLFEVYNTPSNNNIEQSIINGLAIVEK